MRVQNINNQQSFKANACFIPRTAPMNLRRLSTSEGFLKAMKKLAKETRGKMSETDVLKEIRLVQALDARVLLENLHLAIRKGKIKRSSQAVVPPKYYTKVDVFELKLGKDKTGDKLVLCSKPDFFDGSVGASSIIKIEHVANGYEGTTHIERNNFTTEIDPEFDALAEALNKLPK